MAEKVQNALVILVGIILALFVLSFIFGMQGGLDGTLSFVWVSLEMVGIYYPGFIPNALLSNNFIILADVFGSIEFVLMEAVMTAIFYSFIEPMKISEIINIHRFKRLRNHTVIVSFNNLAEELATELHKKNKSYVILAENEKDAKFLYETSKPFVVGRLDNAGILSKVNLSTASTVILCGENSIENATFALNVKEANSNAKIIARVGKEDNISQLKKIGVDFFVEPEISGGIELGNRIGKLSGLKKV